MKQGIHPKIYEDAKIICTCGNNFVTNTTVPEIHIEVCNNCHPFFTGEMKYVDTLGKVEKFQQAQKKAQEIKVKKQEVTKQKEERKRPGSLREMLALAKKQASS